MQVVHFDTPLQRPASSWVRGTNTFLPADIAVQWAQPVPDGFHARASAIARRYAYVLLQSPVRPSVDAGRVGWVFYPLDHAAMLQAAQQLLGEHDFTSFRASACQAKSPVKTLQRIEITRTPSSMAAPPEGFAPCYWRFEFEANAFLHHMIRNIMGCLIAVGQGKKTTAMDRRSAGCALTRRCGTHLFARRPVFSGPGLRTPLGPAQPHGCV